MEEIPGDPQRVPSLAGMEKVEPCDQDPREYPMGQREWCLPGQGSGPPDELD